MGCENLKVELDTIRSLETGDPYFAEAESHLKSCAPCRDRLAKRLEAERSIKMTMDAMAPLPETIISSVISNTRSVRPIKSQWRKWGAVAASFFLVIGLSSSGFSYWNKLQSEKALKRLCILSIKNHEMHTSPEFTSTDAEQVAKWLSGLLNRIVNVPKVVSASAVEGGRRSPLGEHVVAVFQFEIDGKRSTIFSFYPQQYSVEGAMELPKNDMGYTVAVWSENGLGYSLVSEAPTEKVKTLFARANVI